MPPSKSKKKSAEHEWTDFEKHTLLCLMAKGMHHEVKDSTKKKKSSYDDEEEASKTNTYLNVATALNNAVHQGDYTKDIDKKEVTAMIDKMMVEYKGVLGKGGLLERQKVPRMTRGMKLMLSRNPTIKHNGTMGEWQEGGRKPKELARLEIMAYRHRVWLWRREDWRARKYEQPPWRDAEMARGTCRGYFFGGVEELPEQPQRKETETEKPATPPRDEEEFDFSFKEMAMQGLLDAEGRPIKVGNSAVKKSEEPAARDRDTDEFLINLADTISNVGFAEANTTRAAAGSSLESHVDATAAGPTPQNEVNDQQVATPSSTRTLKKPVPKNPHLKKSILRQSSYSNSAKHGASDSETRRPTFADSSTNFQPFSMRSNRSDNPTISGGYEQSMTSYSNFSNNFRPTDSTLPDYGTSSTSRRSSAKYVPPTTGGAGSPNRVRFAGVEDQDGDAPMELD